MNIRVLKPRPDEAQSRSGRPSATPCSSNRVDVWRVLLDRSVSAVQVDKVLSTDELARARRFHFKRDYLSFVRCRTALRFLLGRYLGMSANEIRFQYGTNGKPEIAAEQNQRRLRFNLSHSADLALIAVSADHRLGVDVEKIRTDIDTAALSELSFSAPERASLAALPQNLQLQGFFACWTRKEALLKAMGDGLSFPLSDVTVSTHPELNPEIKEIRGDSTAAQHWFLADIEPKNGYRATLATEGLPASVETYRWN